MKKTLLVFTALLSMSAFAAPIQGTLMLRGSLKTKIVVNTVESTCRLKVVKVKNILEEDSFGNPGYSAQIEINLDGSDFERDLKVKLEKKISVINMFTEGTTRQVKDLDYFNAAEKITVKIDPTGRLVSTTFPFQSQTITCKF